MMARPNSRKRSALPSIKLRTSQESVAGRGARRQLRSARDAYSSAKAQQALACSWDAAKSDQSISPKDYRVEQLVAPGAVTARARSPSIVAAAELLAVSDPRSTIEMYRLPRGSGDSNARGVWFCDQFWLLSSRFHGTF